MPTAANIKNLISQTQNQIEKQNGTRPQDIGGPKSGKNQDAEWATERPTCRDRVTYSVRGGGIETEL